MYPYHTALYGALTSSGPAGAAPRRLVSLLDPAAGYAPPYERPLEDEFAWHLVKYLAPLAQFEYQASVHAEGLPVWVDFVLTAADGRRIGFELGELGEGRDFAAHTTRDALLMETPSLDVLYRFRGTDLLHRLHDVLYLVSVWDPTLFSERGRINLHTLASRSARACRPTAATTLARIAAADGGVVAEPDADYDTDPAPEALAPDVLVKRLHRHHAAPWSPPSTHQRAA
ncbi:MAG: hypothetical protein AAGI71_15285 [Bacteroidota bacterium]